jgi:hypothetical protein
LELDLSTTWHGEGVQKPRKKSKHGHVEMKVWEYIWWSLQKKMKRPTGRTIRNIRNSRLCPVKRTRCYDFGSTISRH